MRFHFQVSTPFSSAMELHIFNSTLYPRFRANELKQNIDVRLGFKVNLKLYRRTGESMNLGYLLGLIPKSMSHSRNFHSNYVFPLLRRKMCKVHEWSPVHTDGNVGLQCCWINVVQHNVVMRPQIFPVKCTHVAMFREFFFFFLETLFSFSLVHNLCWKCWATISHLQRKLKKNMLSNSFPTWITRPTSALRKHLLSDIVAQHFQHRCGPRLTSILWSSLPESPPANLLFANFCTISLLSFLQGVRFN